jgi:hypothetical protein
MKFRCRVSQMRLGSSLWIVLVLLVSCGNKADKVTREQCNAVADHITEVIMAHYSSRPDELWDGMGEPHETGVPAAVSRESFATWLASPEGRTWTMQRHGQVRSATEAGVEPCVEAATPALVRCLLAAKSREDINACDQEYPARGTRAPVTTGDPAK